LDNGNIHSLAEYLATEKPISKGERKNEKPKNRTACDRTAIGSNACHVSNGTFVGSIPVRQD
jgi:hypothetical protein